MNEFKPVSFKLCTQKQKKRFNLILYWLIALSLLTCAGCYTAGFDMIGVVFGFVALGVATLRWLEFASLEVHPHGSNFLPDGEILTFDSSGIWLDSKEKFFIPVTEIEDIPIPADKIMFLCRNGVRYYIPNTGNSLTGYRKFYEQVWIPYCESQINPDAPQLYFKPRVNNVGLNMKLWGKEKPRNPDEFNIRFVFYMLAVSVFLCAFPLFLGLEEAYPLYISAVILPLCALGMCFAGRNTRRLTELTREYKSVTLSGTGMDFQGETSLHIPWGECSKVQISRSGFIFCWQDKNYELRYRTFRLSSAAEKYLAMFLERYAAQQPKGGRQ